VRPLSSDLIGRRATDHTLVSVAFECPPAHAVPPRPVGVRAASLPVGVALTFEGFREPVVATLVTAQRYLAGDVARVPFDRSVTDGAVRLDLSTTPAWMFFPFDDRWVAPVRLLYTVRTVQPFFVRGIVIERRSTESTLCRLFLVVVVRVVLAGETDCAVVTVVGTVSLLVATVKLFAAVITFAIRQPCVVYGTVVYPKPSPSIEHRSARWTLVSSHHLSLCSDSYLKLSRPEWK
jgi:hypothetical protein